MHLLEFRYLCLVQTVLGASDVFTKPAGPEFFFRAHHHQIAFPKRWPIFNKLHQVSWQISMTVVSAVCITLSRSCQMQGKVAAGKKNLCVSYGVGKSLRGKGGGGSAVWKSSTNFPLKDKSY